VTSISRLLEDPAQRKRLGAAGRALAQESYSWDRFTAETERIYRRAEDHARARR
jgi:glycosyltransferase involved in cell wall biosynthesis